MIYVDLWFAVMPFESVIFFRLCVCPLTRAVRWTAVVAKFWEGGNGVRSPRFVMTFLRSFKTHGEVSWRCVWHFLNSTKALQKSNKPLLYCEFCGDCRNIQCICTFSRLCACSFAVVLKDKGTWMQCSSALLPVWFRSWLQRMWSIHKVTCFVHHGSGRCSTDFKICYVLLFKSCCRGTPLST